MTVAAIPKKVINRYIYLVNNGTLNLEKGQYLGLNHQYDRQEALTFIDTTYHKKVFNGWHAHERAHLTFMLNGGNREQRSNSDEPLLTGQVVFYHSQELHRNDHTVFPSRNLNLEIDPVFFKEYNVTEQQFDLALKAGKLTSLEFTRLFNESVFKDVLTKESLQLLLLSYLGDTPVQNTPEWLFRIRDLLNDRWYSWPTLAELAAETSVHPVTLSKYFHRFFGCTLSTYMRNLKAQHGLVMIRSEKYSLSEISHACGYSDQSHFIRCFKAATGMLPKQFERF